MINFLISGLDSGISFVSVIFISFSLPGDFVLRRPLTSGVTSDVRARVHETVDVLMSTWLSELEPATVCDSLRRNE